MTKKVQATVPLIQVPLNGPVTAVYRPLDWEAILLTDLSTISLMLSPAAKNHSVYLTASYEQDTLSSPF